MECRFPYLGCFNRYTNPNVCCGSRVSDDDVEAIADRVRDVLARDSLDDRRCVFPYDDCITNRYVLSDTRGCRCQLYE